MNALQPRSDEETPAFVAALDLPGLFDVHVHFMPPRLMRRIWEYFDAAGPLVGQSWQIRYRWPDDARLAHLRSLRVLAYTALAYPHRPGMAAELNEWTLDLARANSDCVPTATFFPEPAAAGIVENALARGVRAFKAHPQVGDFDLNDPLLDGVWGVLAEAGVPVIIHAGHVPVPTRHTGPAPMTALLARFPRLAAIIAHMGAPDYADFLQLAETYENVRLDTSMTFTPLTERHVPFPADFRSQLRSLGLAGKVLLGSDYPNIPHPYAEQLASLSRLDLGTDWLRAVCWQNASRLFGWDALPGQ
jgi:hypothetical protein